MMRAVSKKLVHIFVVLALAGLAIAGCGSSDDSSSSTQAAATTEELTRPEVTVPEGAPPTELEVKEVVEGTGREAKVGDGVTVQYHIVDYENGKLFDSTWDHSSPFSFKLGTREVMPGMEQGIEGMKVGGRRELIVPSKLGFGDKKNGSLPPNTDLVVVVDLLGVL
jgi:peptidylprolyl isomerase